MKATIGKSFHFDAAHFIPEHSLCGEVHGHTFTVNVEVTGEIQSDGFVLDLHILTSIMKDILVLYDHKTLNEVLLHIPTVENLSHLIGAKLKTVLMLQGYSNLECIVSVQEGKGGWAKCHLPS